MKLRHLLFGVLAGVAFVACTNDNEPAGVTPVKGDNEVAAIDGYMSLKFAMPGDNATTRAEGWSNEDGFLAADADEIAVSGATILFFDGDVQVADPFTTSEYNSGWSAGQGSIDMEHEAIIVLKNAVKNPTSIVAILNALPEGVTVSRSTTMPQLLALAGDFRKDDAKNFVMTNSVFVVGEGNEAKVQIGAPVTDANVQKTAALAEQNPVTIYVEKVVAKAKLTNGNDTDTGVTTKPKAGETTGKKISVTVDKWWLDNANPQSFLVKNLATSYTELGDWSGWKDATNFRSYWATPAEGTLEHSEYTEGVDLDEAIYALENTDQANPTQLVVAATLTVEGATAGTSIVKYLSEVYTAPDFETLLYGMISEKYFTRTETQTAQGTEYDYQPVPQTAYTFTFATNKKDADVTFDGKKIEDYEAVVSVTYGGEVSELYTYNSVTETGAPVVADDFAADLASLKRKVQYWDGGATYYFTPIVHNKDVLDADKNPLYGIIRNHLYDITIKSITGLGTPIANTTSGKEIIPDIPVDEETYLAAEVKILKYKVVKNEVDLGK
jgi:hypothetical protein